MLPDIYYATPIYSFNWSPVSNWSEVFRGTFSTFLHDIGRYHVILVVDYKNLDLVVFHSSTYSPIINYVISIRHYTSSVVDTVGLPPVYVLRFCYNCPLAPSGSTVG